MQAHTTSPEGKAKVSSESKYFGTYCDGVLEGQENYNSMRVVAKLGIPSTMTLAARSQKVSWH